VHFDSQLAKNFNSSATAIQSVRSLIQEKTVLISCARSSAEFVCLLEETHAPACSGYEGRRRESGYPSAYNDCFPVVHNLPFICRQHV
jgi:hypothetical protein